MHILIRTKRNVKENMHCTSWILYFSTFFFCSTQLESGIPWEVRGVEVERVVGGDKEGRTHRLDLKEFQWYINLILSSKKSKSKDISFSIFFNGSSKSFLFTGKINQ